MASFAFLMPVPWCQTAFAADGAPIENDISAAFSVELPPYWSIDAVDIVASINDGDAVEPRYRQRFVATVLPREELYAPAFEDAVIGPYTIVMRTATPADTYKLYGIARSTLAFGKWATTFDMENAVETLGAPLSSFSPQVLIAGSDEAKEFLAELVQAQELRETAEASATPLLGRMVRWKMASAFAGGLVQLGDQGRMIERRVSELSGGQMELKFFEPGALVPPLEIFDAVSRGSVDAGWTAAGY